jgi:cytidylate kinase
MKTFLKFLAEGVNDKGIFKCIYIIGPAGSGKTFITKKITGGLGLRTINSDETFEYMLKKAEIVPDFNAMDKETAKQAEDIRKQSRKIMFKKKDNLLDGRLGIIIDTPGTRYNFIADDKFKLESLGYDCMMVFCAVKMQTAKNRNQERERKIPSASLEKDYKSIMSNIKYFQDLFGDDFVLINSENTEQKEFDDVWKKVKKFVEKPATKKIALKWIKKQLEPEPEPIPEPKKKDKKEPKKDLKQFKQFTLDWS